MSEKEDEASCFRADGIVAEMVIEVEENQKSAVDELANSPIKNLSSEKKDSNDCEKETEEIQLEPEGKEDKENVNEEVAKTKDDENLNIKHDKSSSDIKEDENLNAKQDKNSDIEEDENLNTKPNESNSSDIEDENLNTKLDESNSDIEDENLNTKLDESNSDIEDENLNTKQDESSSDVQDDEDLNTEQDKSSNDTKGENLDLKQDKKSNNIKEDKNMNMKKDKNTNHTLKRKRASELNVSDNENKNIVSDIPRYSGSKKRKVETDSKEMRKASDDKDKKRSLRKDKESILSVKEDFVSNFKTEFVPVKNKSESKGDTSAEIDVAKSKQAILRKLPFRKNKDAPDVPDLSPNVFWYNGVGKGKGVKLGDIPDMKERIQKAKSIRSLYRVLFYQWPTNGQDLIGEILDFNGFPFDKSSYEYTKRQSLMKIMIDATISNLCDILDLRKGAKLDMIDNILNFLLAPYAKIDPSLEPSLQPVVLLERIVEFDDYFDKSSSDINMKKGTSTARVKEPVKKIKENTEIFVTPVRTTRNSAIKRKSTESSSSNKPSGNKKGNLASGKTSVKQANRPVSTRTTTEKITASKETKLKTAPLLKDVKQSSKVSKNKVEEKSDSTSKSANKNVNQSKKLKESQKKEKFVSKKVISKKSSNAGIKSTSIENETKENHVDKELDLSEDVEMEINGKSQESSAEIKENNKKELEKVASVTSTITLSDSSETESAEETKLITAAHKNARKVTPKKRWGKPLGHFPTIRECIQKANFSALQRLHILLFGASDKADNLKTNILAFGGFPFLEGSDEWKQKHFLLSLLAQNNLREYLNLLCIKYSDDDQPTMISKLMKFLAVPSYTASSNTVQPIEFEIVSSVPTNKAPAPNSSKGKVEAKKKVKKKDPKKVGTRHRKVLMSEEEARRMEASFAREQRAMARESKQPPPISRYQVTTPVTQVASITPITTITHRKPKSSLVMQPLPTAQLKPPVADPNQLNALLQTVYKRRALKAAGAVVSTPNKGEKTKLGDIENIKFLIVTANLSDLEILHHLIFMMEAGKARLRKNILDFEGFGFNEDSDKYKERINFLYGLGYDVSKRISFLLGLCSLQTEIPQQDLNELIMYFLMSPCRTKQVVPITEMPTDPSIGSSDDTLVLFKTTSDIDKTSYYQNVLRNAVAKPSATENIQTSTPLPKASRQKAKKSFSTSLKVSPVKKVLLPPSNVNTGMSKQVLGNKPPLTLLDSARALPSFSLAKLTTNVLNATNNIPLPIAQPSNINQFVRFPANPLAKVQLMNPPSKVNVLDAATKVPSSTVSNIPKQILSSPATFSQVSNKLVKQPQTILPAPLSEGSKVIMQNPPGHLSSPQEFLVQQQTPDGQQKTFKLIRLPANHPLATVVKPVIQQVPAPPSVQQQVVFTTASPPVQQQVLLTSAAPSFVIMKNNPGLPPTAQNPQKNLKSAYNEIKKSSSISCSKSNDNSMNKDDSQSAETLGDSNNSVESLDSSQENPPTDKELFSKIQDIILSANFEDITLRNVIEKVSAQFPLHDLIHRHNFMKECVKKIIMGTT